MTEVSFKGSERYVFKISLFLINFSFLTSGIGNYFFKIILPFDISTLGIYFLFVLQLFTGTLKINKYVILSFSLIFINTFLINYNKNLFDISLRHFLGLTLFVLSFFSFLSNYRSRLKDIIKSYFNFTLFISYFSFFQLIFFVLFDLSIIPQNTIAGIFVTGNENFVTELFNFLPRSFGLYTEPANFSIYLLPSVYISLHFLFNGNYFSLNITFRDSIAIVIAFLLSFSLVGYLGLFLIIISLFLGNFKVNKKKIITFSVAFVILLYFIFQTFLGNKILSFLISTSDLANTEYNTNNQTTFALVSNYLVAKQALFESHYLGFGLNSHQLSYNKYINTLFTESNIPAELNKENAGSLFIRIISEFGIPGIALLGLFFFYNKCKKISFNGSINELSLISILTYMFRTGHYISNFLIFFLAVYVYTKINEKFESKI